MSEVSEYYLRWLKTAFRSSWGVTSIFVFFASIAIAYVQDKRPDWLGTMNHLVWQVPIVIFLILAFIGLVIAPYSLHKEVQKTQNRDYAQIEQRLGSVERHLADEKSQRLRAELQLAEEKASKLSVNEIVLKESREGFRNLTSLRNSTIAPRTVLNEKWIQATAEKYGRTVEEISQAIDRLDGKFHWQV